jgi:hypothetical protein
MTTQSLTLNHQTRIAVQIIIEDDTGLLTFSTAVVTSLFTLFWQVSQTVSAIRSEWSAWVSDIKAALDFTGKVLSIGFNALAYGLGVKL